MIFIERIIGIGKRKKHIYFWRVITVFLIYLGWIVFRSTSLEQAFVFYSNIFYPYNWDITLSLLSTLTHKNIIMITIGFLSVFFPKGLVIGRYLESENNKTAVLSRIIVMIPILMYTMLIIASSHYSPFLYFQF